MRGKIATIKYLLLVQMSPPNIRNFIIKLSEYKFIRLIDLKTEIIRQKKKESSDKTLELQITEP